MLARGKGLSDLPVEMHREITAWLQMRDLCALSASGRAGHAVAESARVFTQRRQDVPWEKGFSRTAARHPRAFKWFYAKAAFAEALRKMRPHVFWSRHDQARIDVLEERTAAAGALQLQSVRDDAELSGLRRRLARVAAGHSLAGQGGDFKFEFQFDKSAVTPPPSLKRRHAEEPLEWTGGESSSGDDEVANNAGAAPAPKRHRRI
jgi:hypothetical protein